jgi:RimJ/RimL family protein N-acetyltransferase
MRSAKAFELATSRLVLVPLTEADIDALHALWTAPAVRYFLWDDVVIPRERTAAVVAESAELFAARGFGLWGARLRRAAELVGFGGFWAFRDPPVFELLYGVATDRWGVGLATELAGALVRYGREGLGWSELRASTDAPNGASIRVLEKLGFQLEQRAVVSGLDTLFYRLVRPAPPNQRMQPTGRRCPELRPGASSR